MDQSKSIGDDDWINVVVTLSEALESHGPAFLVQIEVNQKREGCVSSTVIGSAEIPTSSNDVGSAPQVRNFGCVALTCSATWNAETNQALFFISPVYADMTTLHVSAEGIRVVVTIESGAPAIEVLSVAAKAVELRGLVNPNGDDEAAVCVLKQLSLSAQDALLSGCLGAERLLCDVSGTIRVKRGALLAHFASFKCQHLAITSSSICSDTAKVQAISLFVNDCKLVITTLFASTTAACCAIRSTEIVCEGEVQLVNGLDSEWNRQNAPVPDTETYSDETRLAPRHLSIEDSSICALTGAVHIASQHMTFSARSGGPQVRGATATAAAAGTSIVGRSVILELGCNRFGSSVDRGGPPVEDFADPALSSWPHPTLATPTAGVSVMGHLSLLVSGHGDAFNQGELSSGGFLNCALRGSLCNLGLILADGEVDVEVLEEYTSSGSGVIASNSAAVAVKACSISLSQEACISAAQELSVSCRDLHLRARGTKLLAKGDISVRCLHLENRGKVHSSRTAVLTIGRRANKHVITLKESAKLLVVPNVYFREISARAAPPQAPAAATTAEEGKAAGAEAKQENVKDKENNDESKEGENGKGAKDGDKKTGEKGGEDAELGFPDEGELVNLGGVIAGVAGVRITASSRVSNARTAEGYAAAILAALPSVGATESKEDEPTEPEPEGLICSTEGSVHITAEGDIHNDYAGAITAEKSLTLRSQGRNILNCRHSSITCASGKATLSAGSFMQTLHSALRVRGSLRVTLLWCLHNKTGSEIRIEQVSSQAKQKVVLQLEEFSQIASTLVSCTDIRFRPAARFSVFVQDEKSQVVALQGGVHFERQLIANNAGAMDQAPVLHEFALVTNSHSKIYAKTSVRFEGDVVLKNISGAVHAGGVQVLPASLCLESDAASVIVSETSIEIREYLGRLKSTEGGAAVGCGVFRAPRIVLDINGCKVVDLASIVYADLVTSYLELRAQGAVVQNRRLLRIPLSIAILCHRFANSDVLEIDGRTCSITATVIINSPEPVRNHFAFGYNKDRSLEHDINVGDYFAARKDLVFEELLVVDTARKVGSAEIHCSGSLTLHAAAGTAAPLPGRLTERAGNKNYLPGGIYTAMGGISAVGDITVQAKYLINGVPTHDLQIINLSHIDPRLTAFQLGFYNGNMSFISAGGAITLKGNEGHRNEPISVLNFLGVIEAGRGFNMDNAELLLNYGGQISASASQGSADAGDIDKKEGAADAPAVDTDASAAVTCSSLVNVRCFYNVAGARRYEDPTRGTFLDYTITSSACFHTTGKLTVHSADFRNIGSYVMASKGMRLEGAAVDGAADVFEGTLLNDALSLMFSQLVWQVTTTVTRNSRNCCGVRYGSNGTITHNWSQETIHAAHHVVGAAIVSDVALTLKYQRVVSTGLLFAPVMSITAVHLHIGAPAVGADPPVPHTLFGSAAQTSPNADSFPLPPPMAIAGAPIVPLTPFVVRGAGIGNGFTSSREWWAAFINKHGACFSAEATAGWARAAGAQVSVQCGDLVIGEGGVVESLDGAKQGTSDVAGAAEAVFTHISAAGNVQLNSGVIHSDGATKMRIGGSLFARTLVQRLALLRTGNWSADSGGWYERAKQIARISGMRGLDYEILTGDEVLQGAERHGGSGGIRSLVAEGSRIHTTVSLSSHLHYVSREKEDVREELSMDTTTHIQPRTITTSEVVDLTPKGMDERVSEYLEAASVNRVAAEIRNGVAYNVSEFSLQVDENDGWNKDNYGHQSGSQQAIPSTYNIAKGGTVRMTALKGNISLCGVHINAMRTFLQALEREVQLTPPVNHFYSQTFESNTSPLWQGVEMDKRHDQTYLLNHFSGTVELEARTLLIQSVSGHLCNVLPMIVLKGETVLVQQYLDEVHEHEHFEQDGPTAALAIVVALAASIASCGAASAIVGPALASAVGLGGCVVAEGMFAAAFTCLCSQAAVSMVKNKMDPFAAAKDLATTDTLKSMAVSMIAAGLTAGLENVTGFTTDPTKVTGFQGHLMNQTNRTLAGMGAGIVVGERPDITKAVVNTAVATGAAMGASELGLARTEGKTNDVEHFGGHFVNGFVAGAAANKGDLKHGFAGGVSATTAEIIAEAQIPTGKDVQRAKPVDKRFAHGVAKLTVAAGALATGASAPILNSALTGATNALDYNHGASINRNLTINGKPLQTYPDEEEQADEPAKQPEKDPFAEDAIMLAKMKAHVQKCQDKADNAKGAFAKLAANFELAGAIQAFDEATEDAASRRAAIMAAKYTAEHPYKVAGALCMGAAAVVAVPITVGSAVAAGALGAVGSGLSWYDDHRSTAAPVDLADLSYDQGISLASNVAGGAVEPFLFAARPLRVALGAAGLYGAYTAADNLGAPEAVTAQLQELSIVAGGGAVIGGGMAARQLWGARTLAREAAFAANHTSVGGALIDVNAAQLVPVPFGHGIQAVGRAGEANCVTILEKHFQIVPVQAPNGTGIDVLGWRTCPQTGKTTIILVESKTTEKAAGGAQLNMTRNGRQMEQGWVDNHAELLSKRDRDTASAILQRLQNGATLEPYLFVQRPQGWTFKELPALDAQMTMERFMAALH